MKAIPQLRAHWGRLAAQLDQLYALARDVLPMVQRIMDQGPRDTTDDRSVCMLIAATVYAECTAHQLRAQLVAHSVPSAEM